MAAKKKTIADTVLIAVLLFVGLGFYCFTAYGNVRGKEVLVCVDGREIGRYSLKEDAIVSLNDGSNVMVIKNGEAYIVEANCPDHLCVKQGKISRSRQCITCLPNHLTVSVEGESDDVDVIG